MDEKASESHEALPLPAGYLKVIRTLWRGRRLIVGCTLLCAVAAAVVSLLLPEAFESSVSLILFPTPLKESKDVSELVPRVLTVPDYGILLQSDGVLLKAVEKVKAAESGHWPETDLEKLDEMSNLRKRMRLQVEVIEKSAYGVKHSPVIVLKASAHTPKQAQELAQAWADASEDLATSLYRTGKIGLKQFVEKQFATSKKEFLKVAGEIRDLEIAYNDELTHARMADIHKRLLSYESSLADLRINMKVKEVELKDIKEKFAIEPEKKVLWKSPPMTAVFLEQETRTGGVITDAKQQGKQVGYQDELLNPTWVSLKKQMFDKETEVFGLEEREQQFVATLKEIEDEYQELRELTATRSFDRKQLDLEEVPLKESYDLLAMKLEKTKIVESDQEDLADIKIATSAVLPDRKISPMRSLIVAVATVLGFLFSVTGVWFRGVVSEFA